MENILRKSIFISLLISLSLVAFIPRAKAEIDPRIMALATVTGYGTAGGALLGTASMAFGTKTRAIAQGASIGLYLGLIFGSYIVVSHTMSKPGAPGSAEQENGYYYDDVNPYGGDKGGGADNPAPAPKLYIDHDLNRLEVISAGHVKRDIPLFYLNLLDVRF